MKVRVKISRSGGAQEKTDTVELDLANPTLKTVLERVSRDYENGGRLFNPETGDVDSEGYTVLLNGSAYQFLPQKLQTPLSEGDEVQLFRWFELLGGG
ncbi:MAG: hypothetical protein HY673_07845 [Chloroflexi bacterium]|nr:hypothetical protein [Chloroflexota bacterium]